MATVPGDPNEGGNVVQMLPKQFQPTMADFLQAAHIMDQKGRLRLASDADTPSDPRSVEQPSSPLDLIKSQVKEDPVGAPTERMRTRSMDFRKAKQRT